MSSIDSNSSPADDPQTHVVRLSDEMLGDLKAAALICRQKALEARDYGLATRYQVVVEALERA